MIYTLRFIFLQNTICFVILTYLVPVSFTFYLQGVLKLKKNNNNSGAKRLKQGRPTRGSPGCVMRPAATFANYVYTTKNAQQFRRFSIQLIAILHVRPANQPVITVVALCQNGLTPLS